MELRGAEYYRNWVRSAEWDSAPVGTTPAPSSSNLLSFQIACGLPPEPEALLEAGRDGDPQLQIRTRVNGCAQVNRRKWLRVEGKYFWNEREQPLRPPTGHNFSTIFLLTGGGIGSTISAYGKADCGFGFVFERDGVAYGVEIKNTLGYMEYGELQTKVRLCEFLGIRPVFCVRMMPKSWIKELIDARGFALILKYQLYPWTHRELAARVARELGLPVSSPRALEDGTMLRFVRWHERNV